MSDRLDNIESRVERIEDALLELRINVGNLVGELKALRFIILALGTAVLGVDITGM